MAFNLPTNLSTLEAWAGALYGYSIGSTTMAQVNADITSYGGLNNTLNAYYTAAFGSQTTATVAKTIVANVGLGTDANAIAYVTGQLNAATPAIRGAAVANILNAFAALTADPTYGSAATAWNTTVANSVSYESSNAGDTTLAGVTSALAASNAAAAAAAAAKAQAALTQVFTTEYDNLTGPAGSTYIADNTGSSATLQPADTVTGTGTGNSLKVYMTSSATSTGATLSQISGIQSLYLKSGDLASLDLSTSSFTSVTLDSPVIPDASATTVAGAGSATYTLNGQTVTLANAVADSSATDIAAGTDTLKLASTNDTSENVTLQYWTSTKSGTVPNTTTQTLDIGGTKVTSLTLNSAGVSTTGTNSVLITNTGAAITSLNITGSNTLTVTQYTSTTSSLATVNASATTGTLTFVDTAQTVPINFTFTGGSGTDSLSITTASLEHLASGSQLNGGSGSSNVLYIYDMGTLATADYAALNATTGFNILGVGYGSGSTTYEDSAAAIDLSKLTNGMANHVKTYDQDSLTITNAGSNLTLDVVKSNDTLTVSPSLLAQTNLTVNLSPGSTSGGITTDSLVTTGGISTVNIASNAGTSANTITAYHGTDNQKIVISGSDALTIGNVSANTAVGDSIDASGFTKTLTLGTSAVANTVATHAGDTGMGDLIKLGTGTTTLVISAGALAATGETAGDQIILAPGHTNVDTIDSTLITTALQTGNDPYANAAEATAGMTIITNFNIGAVAGANDVLKFTIGGTGPAIGSAATDLTGGTLTWTVNAGGFATASGATPALFIHDAVAGAVNVVSDDGYGEAVAYTDGTNTYVALFDDSATGSVHIVELVGVNTATALGTAAAANTIVIA
jgi:hypothetical protein